MNRLIFLAISLFFSEALIAQTPSLSNATLHRYAITDAAISDDGRFIVSVAGNNEAILWNARTTRKLKTFNPVGPDLSEDGSVSKVSISADGSKALICNDLSSYLRGRSGPLILEMGSLNKITNLDRGILEAKFSPDGKYIAGINDFGALLVYRASDLKLLNKFENTAPGKKNNDEMEESVFLNFSADGKFVITLSFNGAVVIWNIETGTFVALKERLMNINDAQFRPDGKFVVTASRDKTLKIWDTGTGAAQLVIPLKQSAVRAFFNVNNASGLKGGEHIVALYGSSGTALSPAVFNAKDGKMIKELDNLNADIGFYTKDGKALITASHEGPCKIWNAETFDMLDTQTPIDAYQYSANNKFLVTTSSQYSQYISSWDLEKLKPLDQFKGYDPNSVNDADPDIKEMISDPLPEKESVDDLSYSPDKQYRYESTEKSGLLTLKIIEVGSDKIIFTINQKARDAAYAPLSFSPDNKLAAVIQRDKDMVLIVDLKDGNVINSISDKFTGQHLYSLYFSPDSKHLLLYGTKEPIARTNNSAAFAKMKITGRSVHDILELGRSVEISPGPSLVDVFTGQKKSTLEFLPDGITACIFSPVTPAYPTGGEYLVTMTSFGTSVPIIKIWNTATGAFIATLETDKIPIQKIQISPDAKYIFTDGGARLFKQWDLRTGKFLSAFYPGADGKYTFQITADGYYQGKKEDVAGMYYVTEDFKVISSDQLDFQYNRPDKVIAITGSGDEELKTVYEKAHQQRVKASDLGDVISAEGKERPEATILNEDYTVRDSIYKLHINALDVNTVLKRINIYVNNVPVYGSKGLSVLPGNRKEIDTVINIVLFASSRWEGKNKIEVSVTNASNVESYRAQLVLNYSPDADGADPRLHFIGIGINKYADTADNLKYSLNDIRDLAVGLGYRYLNRITVDTLFNGEVTRKNIAGLKAHLKTMGVGDKVIVAFSGHGLSRDKRLYLPTSDTDFEKPEQNSIPYSDLEDLLDDIPPRQKLLLVDACNSGDYDKTLTEEKSGRRKELFSKNSFELMRDLFVNVEKGTGTTVIASCGASRLALANGNIKHSLFIHSCLEMIFNEQHYVDFITQRQPLRAWSLNVLKDYVSERVPELSEKAQVPIIRSENAEFDWDIYP